MERFNFFDEVHDFQRFIRENIYLIGNYTIISEQLTMRNNETGIVDMLAVDNIDNKLTIIELKNELTTDKNVWQPIRYYDLIKRGEDSIKELLFKASSKLRCDVDSIDINPKVILVVPRCNDQLLRTLSYFEDIDSKVIEITRYKNNNIIETKKQTFYPRNIVHKEDLVDVVQKVTPEWNFEEYSKRGISKLKLDLALRMMLQIKTIFESKSFKYDVFFTETKITIMKNEKVWGYLFIKQKPLDHNLTISFKVSKYMKVDKYDFSYNYSIESVDAKESTIKLLINNVIPSNLIEKYL